MKPEEVADLLSVCSVYQQATGRDMDPVKVSQAWYMALDVRMTLEDATLIVMALASENTWISPGSINERYLARYRKGHEQGSSRPKLPIQAQPVTASPAPLTVGSDSPVHYSDVPEYMEKRRKQPRSWSVECPYCGAKPGNPCTVLDGKRKVPLRHREAHPSREEEVSVPSSR